MQVINLRSQIATSNPKVPMNKQDLSTSAGEPTGATKVVISMIRKLLADYEPEYIAVVFDAKGKTFREELYAEYKANRPPMPEDMAASQARNFIESAYREYGGYEGAYTNARTGKAGGMRAVLNSIADAIRQGASDIHFECYEKRIRVRCRYDGDLQETASIG